MSDKTPFGQAAILIVSGPSGVGKTTVCNELLARPEVTRVITATTRQPRGREIHGKDYWFYAEQDFQELLKNQYFLEHALVHGKLYGTPKQPVLDALSQGQFVLLNIDIQGAETIRAKQDLPLKTFFLVPPSLKELERRLRSRNTETEENIRRRLARAEREINQQENFDHVIVNSSVAEAVAQIEGGLQLCLDSRR